MKAVRMLQRISLLTLLTIVPWGAASCGGSTAAEDAAVSKQAALTAKEVSTVPVSRRDFEQALSATGSLIPTESANIRALEPGPIVALPVDIGQPVRAGQVLFRVRPVEAENAVRSAEAQKATAVATLRDLEAWRRPEEVDVLEAQLERARVEARRLENEKERAATLLERGAISQSQWDQAYTAAESAQAALRVAEEQLRIAKAGPTREQLEVARSRVLEAEARLRESRQRLDDTSVEAPYSGVITGRFRKVGDYIQKGQELVAISDLSQLEAEMNIPERYAGMLQVGIPVSVQVDSLRLTREGKVAAVNEAIDQTTRTFLVKVAVDNPDGRIKAGAFCTGQFELPPVDNALAVPSRALLTREGQTFVWVADDGVARQRDVAIGERSQDWIEIVEGLNGSEEVIVEGTGALAEGDQIELTSGASGSSEAQQ